MAAPSRRPTVIAGALVAVCLGGLIQISARQTPVVRPVDERTLREYTGVYQWGREAFVYLQLWDEFSGFGTSQLVAFDESGDVRTLYPIDGDTFFAGPGAAMPGSIESRIAFQRDRAGQIVSLAWQRDGAALRSAAVEYLKTRRDIDSGQIGLLGISQAGWIMPLAAVRSRDVAFLISISGAGVTPAETTIDQARNEMTMTGMPAATVADITRLMGLQYDFARTGKAGTRTPRPARHWWHVWARHQKPRFPAHLTIPNGKRSSGRTFTTRRPHFASSRCRPSRSGAA